MTTKKERVQTFGTKGHFNNTGSSKNISQCNHLKPNLYGNVTVVRGWGQMAKECATPLNYSNGEFQCPSPQIKGEQKPQQTQPKQTPSPSKH